MLRREDLDLAPAAMAPHLAPGGFSSSNRGSIQVNGSRGVTADAASEVDIGVARESRSAHDGNLSRFEFHYAFVHPEGIDTFMEPRVMAYGPSSSTSGRCSRPVSLSSTTSGPDRSGLFIGVAATD